MASRADSCSGSTPDTDVRESRMNSIDPLPRMPEQRRHLVYESGGWVVDLTRRELRTCGDPVPLGKRAFQVFAVLLESAGKLVTKDELMARVWPGGIGAQNTLEVHLSP